MEPQLFYEVVDTAGLADPFSVTWKFGNRVYRNVERLTVRGVLVPAVPREACLVLHMDDIDKHWPVPVLDPPVFQEGCKFYPKIHDYNPPLHALKQVGLSFTKADGAALSPADLGPGGGAAAAPRVSLIVEVRCKDCIIA